MTDLAASFSVFGPDTGAVLFGAAIAAIPIVGVVAIFSLLDDLRLRRSGTSTRPRSIATIYRVALVIALGIGVMLGAIFYDRTRDYGQAEPLVQTIWPMANEMKRFHDEHGRSPHNLDEIDSYSLAFNFSALRAYSHEFTPTSSRRFFLRVNRRFAFAIDDQFTPSWFGPGELAPKPLDKVR